jgi:hypothetical protein
MIKKQYTIADVLHLAADKYLVAHSRYEADHIIERFSCCAIYSAIREINGNLYGEESTILRDQIVKGLRNMGCDVESHSLFEKYGDKPDVYGSIIHDVQGMRYMWLKWAALMAEEQGI